mgnify:CR=1 FL=1|jgi:hypothetical protein
MTKRSKTILKRVVFGLMAAAFILVAVLVIVL